MKDSYFYLKMHTHYINLPYKKEKRRVRVLTPKNYDNSTESYPVVYFHDGQNVFHSSESYSGYSWKVIPAIKRNPDIPKMIIVAIDNDGGNRMDEYTPWPISNAPLPPTVKLGGKGNDYADFIIQEVKPFIDSHYRTKSAKEYTGLIGSSLGGNITSFMGIKYQEVFGNLGIFSLANWITDLEFDHYINHSKLDKNQKIYIQVGTQEGDDTDRQLMNGNMKQAYLDSSLKYYNNLIRHHIPIDNLKFNIMADAEHNEMAWATALPDCLRFFGKDWL